MSSSPKIFEADDLDRGGQPLEERPQTLTPLLEVMHADGCRWASLDVADLDPPMIFPPDVAN